MVHVDERPRAVVAVGDTVKASSRAAVQQLRGLGVEVVLLTGDHPTAAAHVAAEVGITRVVAGVYPDDKVREVARLQEGGEVVAMVGDGVNDAAALVQADLGIAMGTGTDAAIEAGDVTLVNGDPALVASALRLARRTLTVIRQNLFWAFAYNVVGIPVAALGLLDPMLAGAAMAASSVCVVGNSLRLRRLRPGRELTRAAGEVAQEPTRGLGMPRMASISEGDMGVSDWLAATMRLAVSSTSSSSSSSSRRTSNGSTCSGLLPGLEKC